jgi:acyl carrier protein
MGLDVVEIVLRAEEFFAIEICDDEAEAVRTVGDFYNLICRKLEVPALQSPLTSEALPTISEEEKTLVFLYRSTLLRPPPEVLPWSSQSVWDCLVAVLVDQQGLRVEETMYNARFVEDLGVD